MDEIYDLVTEEDIVIDYIDQCESIFRKFGYDNVHVEDYPECLRKYLGRKIWYDTMNSIAGDENKWSAGWFVKPVKSKAFTGKVIQSTQDLIGCGNYSEDYELFVQKPWISVENGAVLYITTESMIYVHIKEIIIIPMIRT